MPVSQEQHSPIALSLPPSGNNRIPELREAQRLRELPKLIILDLSGNPCTSGGSGSRASTSALGAGPASAGAAVAAAAAAAGDDYRLYVVYNVRKLKVQAHWKGEGRPTALEGGCTSAMSGCNPEASVHALALSQSLLNSPLPLQTLASSSPLSLPPPRCLTAYPLRRRTKRRPSPSI